MKNINIDEAKQFLACFVGEHTFQTFSDTKGGNVIPKHITLGFDDLEQENIKGAGIYFMVNRGDGKGRKVQNVVSVRAVFADFDDVCPPSKWKLPPSIVVESSLDRYHVYWLLADIMPLDRFTATQKSIANFYESDPIISDLSRVMRVAGFVHQKRDPFLSHIKFCDPKIRYSTQEILTAHPPLVRANGQHNVVPCGTLTQPSQALPAEQILTIMLQRNNPREGRNKLGFNIACQMRDNGVSQLECENILFHHYQSQYENEGNHPYTQDECLASIRQAYNHAPREPWQELTTNGQQKTCPVQVNNVANVVLGGLTKSSANGSSNNGSKPIIESDTLTDVGNRERFVKQHKDNFRFNPQLGWLTWTGQRWEKDLTEQVNEAAILTVRNIYREVADCDDRMQRDALLKHAKASESRAKIESMVSLAKSSQEMLIRTEELDSNPWLFNVANGTLNLKTRELQPHNLYDYITKYSDVNYDPSAKHQAVEQLLDLLQEDNRAEFLQRSLGSCLIGEVYNEFLWYLVGKAGTGKSTLMEAVMAVLGEYAATTDTSLIIKNNNQNPSAPRPELLTLRGARLVVAKEIPKNTRLNATDIKAMTGGDTMVARALYSNELISFAAEFKLFIHSNFDVKVDWDDDGIKRRLFRVPFNTKPKKLDLNFKNTLKTDPIALSALLNWLFKGFVNWVDNNYDLAIPEDIKNYTKEFWQDADPFYEFAGERLCFTNSEAITPSNDIWQAYQSYCEQDKRQPRRKNELWAWLTKNGCHDGRRTIRTKSGGQKQVRVRLGVSIV